MTNPGQNSHDIIARPQTQFVVREWTDLRYLIGGVGSCAFSLLFAVCRKFANNSQSIVNNSTNSANCVHARARFRSGIYEASALVVRHKCPLYVPSYGDAPNRTKIIRTRNHESAAFESAPKTCFRRTQFGDFCRGVALRRSVSPRLTSECRRHSPTYGCRARQQTFAPRLRSLTVATRFAHSRLFAFIRGKHLARQKKEAPRDCGS